MDIEKIVDIPRHSVVVMRSADMDVEFGGTVANDIALKVGHMDFLVLLLREGDEVNVIDEQQMREFGWVRA